ncbi:hypothetical protein HZH66_010147 [Vespula vulgaris]|uniref:CXXC-type domain-containing protein n=1 Tax=Vespula vulgaris TaxID=7454 RepID=A0A834MXL2_VESVU|nr:hypothetical protein HZH66_010147 [Vespula vulgaris]
MSAEVTKEVVATERVAPSPPAAVATSPTSGDPARHLPPFSSFAGDSTMDSSTTLTTLHSQDVGLGLTSSWDYYEGLTGRLIDSRGEVVLASQYRPWESKNAGGVVSAAAPTGEGLPSFASQFTAPSEAEPQLTALTPLSPASISHSPPVTSAVGLPSFHTLGTPLPAPHPHRGSVGYPLVPAPVQAREVPALQQQLLDERHIQLLGSSPVQAFPPPPGHPHHTVLTVVKPEYPQLHHANFQNPMSTVLDSTPTSRAIGIDGRKKERRKIRAGSMESEDGGGGGGGGGGGAGSVENSGQVAAVSSTANRGPHHMSGGMGDADGDGGLGDKPAKKKRKRCGECIGCQRKDNCGDCAPCRNDKSHQICKMRRCEKLTEKKMYARNAERSDFHRLKNPDITECKVYRVRVLLPWKFCRSAREWCAHRCIEQGVEYSRVGCSNQRFNFVKSGMPLRRIYYGMQAATSAASAEREVVWLIAGQVQGSPRNISHHSDCFPYAQDHIVALFRGHALCIVVLMEIENPRVARGIDRASAEVGGFAPLPSPFSPKYPATSNFPPPFIPTITYTPLVPSLATVPAPTPASSSTVKGFARRESGKLDFLGRRRREEDEKRRKPRE